MEDRLGTQIQQGPNSVFVLKSVLDVRLSKQKKKKNLQGVPLTREPPAQAPLPASPSLLQSPVRIASLPTSVSHCPAVLGTPLPDFAAYSSKLSHPHGSWESLTPSPNSISPAAALQTSALLSGLSSRVSSSVKPPTAGFGFPLGDPTHCTRQTMSSR